MHRRRMCVFFVVSKKTTRFTFATRTKWDKISIRFLTISARRSSPWVQKFTLNRTNVEDARRQSDYSKATNLIKSTGKLNDVKGFLKFRFRGPTATRQFLTRIEKKKNNNSVVPRFDVQCSTYIWIDCFEYWKIHQGDLRLEETRLYSSVVRHARFPMARVYFLGGISIKNRSSYLAGRCPLSFVYFSSMDHIHPSSTWTKLSLGVAFFFVEHMTQALLVFNEKDNTVRVCDRWVEGLCMCLYERLLNQSSVNSLEDLTCYLSRCSSYTCRFVHQDSVD